MPTLKTGLTTAAIATTMLFAGTCGADVWQERQALAALSKELVALEALAREAERYSTDSSRTNFKYNALLEDLRTIRFGIDHHLRQPIEPIDPGSIQDIDPQYTGHDR